MHGGTLLNNHGSVLRPCMLWNDARSHIEAAELDTNSTFRSIKGNIVFPGCAGPKVMRIKK